MRAKQVLIILVCLAVCAVFSILYISRYIVQPKVQTPTANIQSSQAQTIPVEQKPTVVYSTFPRFAVATDRYTVGVTGTAGEENLLDYYCYAGYIFAILSTDTDGGDYRATSPSLGVARFDTDCTLIDTFTLPESEGCSFLCASLYDYGLLIVATADIRLRVWSVSPNLVTSTNVFPYRATHARLLYADGAAVLVFCSDKLYALSLSPSLGVQWAYTAPGDNMRLVDVFPTGQNYTVVCTHAAAGSAYTLNSRGFVARTSIAAVDALTPYAGGFAVVCNATARLYLYDISFGLVQDIPIVRATYAAATSYAGGILLIAQNADGYTGYLYCNHGDVQSTFSLPSGNLLQVVPDQSSFLFSLQSGNLWQAYTYTPYGTAPTLVAEVQGAQHAQLWPLGGYLYAVCDSVFEYGVFGSHLGNRDVYLLRCMIER